MRRLLTTLDRREFLTAAGVIGGVAIVAGTGVHLASAEETFAGATPQFDATYKKILADHKAEETGVLLELPEIAENGNIVPYKIAVESPMTDADFVERVHLLSTANPQASVATFHFTPQSGKAAVMGRMRLAKTQDVVAVAVTSNGQFLLARRNIKVTIGGCGVD